MKTPQRLAATIILAILTLSFIHPDDWIVFESNGYKMLFPKKPADQTQVVNTAIGKLKMGIHMYEVADNEKEDNLVYGLIETEYPDSVINSDKKDLLDNFFKNSIDGAANNVHGKLLSVTEIQLDGYPGRSFRIDLKDQHAVMTMRAYLVKNKMYILQTITEAPKDFNKSINRFMDSFTLKK